MSGSALDRLATRHGLALTYTDQFGVERAPSAETKRALLQAIGVPAGDDDDIANSLAEAPPPPPAGLAAPEGLSCFVPDCLRDGRRVWGIALQLYQVRSDRNWGIGDFEDLARFAEVAAGHGADFIGTNPLHALFMADPARNSPFSPCNRRFLNPLYLAVENVPGFRTDMADSPRLAELRAAELVDYPAVASEKLRVLRALWTQWRRQAVEDGPQGKAAFARFTAERGAPLHGHAVFEALSFRMAREGHGAGWHGWPAAYRDPGSAIVAEFAADGADEVAFHAWLQWLADAQLGVVQARARAAGMRIGLYLDLAVGDAPDGSAAWADQSLLVTGASIGAPPDGFNVSGQDWGLSPLSPAVLRQRDLEPYRQTLADVLRRAGALRIDHAMGICQLYFVPRDRSATEGTYLRYPLAEMLRCLVDVSHQCGAIIIGEDLGTVPHGFRELIAQVEIQSYRVLYFERTDRGLLPPERYPRQALACLSTHDLIPLRGWWSGDDITINRDLDRTDDAMADAAHAERDGDRASLLSDLAEEGLLPAEAAHAADRADIPHDAYLEVAEAVHRHLARAPSRLLAVRLEDLAGERLPVNVPGTSHEHPNWQRKLPLSLDALAETPLFLAIVGGIAAERPRA